MNERKWTGDYCGCCGDQCHGEFCLQCRPHIPPVNGHRHAWERTFFAQHGRDCPLQYQPEESP